MEKIYRVQINSHGMPNFATAEEVVRCKECRFYIADEGKCTRSTWTYDWHRPKTNADDFCSYGERRE